VFSLSDVLGQGATGAVYKARHKTTGELYAVKVFNPMSQMRPIEVQIREYDILLKLNHPNIVKLLAVEEEASTHSKALVMELCTGGSLFHLLDNPENAYGLEEEEFLHVLVDVAAGMKHLRDQDIVHRDIKPGNIMCYVTEDGRSIYKLIDFGAARELQEEEQFMSLYGTEEYLHPDMYERAVLRRPMNKQFGATVDLWSLGVTLYHVATGQLPFRPYGGRRNRETMFQITTRKESGVISGVQHSENGVIEWGRELPKSSRMSVGFKNILTPVLAGLMECVPGKQWTFDKFFEAVHNMSSMKRFHIYSVIVTRVITVYIEEDKGMCHFQELVTEQIEIHPTHQLIMFENCMLTDLVKPTDTVKTYPRTTCTNPLILFTNEIHDFTRIPDPTIPSFPKFSPNQSMDGDAALAKRCASIVFLIKRFVQDHELLNSLFIKAVKMFHLKVTVSIQQVSNSTQQFARVCDEGVKRLLYFTDVHLPHIRMLSLVKGLDEDLKYLTQDLEELQRTIKPAYDDVSHGIEDLKGYVSDYKLRIIDKGELQSKYKGSLQDTGDTPNSIHKANMLAKGAQQILEDFRRDKAVKDLSFNDRQIHRFDKNKLSEICVSAQSLVEHNFDTLKRNAQQFQDWYNLACKVLIRVRRLETQIHALQTKHDKVSVSLDKTTSQYKKRLDTIVRKAEGSFGMKSENITGIHFGGRAVMDCEPSSGYGSQSHSQPPSRQSGDINRTMLKELNQSLRSLQDETSTVRQRVLENTDLLRQLEELSLQSLVDENTNPSLVGSVT